MSPGRWSRRLALALLPALLAVPLATSAVRGAYQATVDVNDSAFEPPCLGFDDPYPEKMLKAAVAGFTALGYDTRGYSGAAFTKAHVLARTVGDWGYYVHSHGDYYWSAADGRRWSGFREDSGDCSQSVVYSKEIAAKRAGRQSNLVIMSTCHLADPNTTMPGAFGIAKSKAGVGQWNGPKFYLGYLGEAWDSDEWIFEASFWSEIGPGLGAGASFDRASLGAFNHAFDADWWGTYSYTGKPGLLAGCDRCL